MRKQDDKARQERRDFLRKVAVAGGSAAVVAATGTAAAAAPEPAEKPAERTEVGYHETDHIRAYYRTARV